MLHQYFQFALRFQQFKQPPLFVCFFRINLCANKNKQEYLDKAVADLGSRITAEDLYSLNLYGCLEAAAAGVTTMFDWSHIMNSPEHADAAIQAAKDAGINVLFFHSTSAIGRDKTWNNSTVNHDTDIERLANSQKTCIKKASVR